ncbi:MAG: helix-turn-helix domain-containing protein [Thermoleophilaceae bacterium]
MDVHSLRDLAAIARGRRSELGLSQAELADRARVSRQWVSAFENGKPTTEIGLAIRLLDSLGLHLTVMEDASAPSPTAVDLDALLDRQRDT